MQNINFNCPHCGNMMAVGENLLGRNVRCPHAKCGKIVKAPVAAGQAATAVAAPPSPSESQKSLPVVIPKPTESHESIFGEVHHEDIFESETAPKPTIVVRNAGSVAPSTHAAMKPPVIPPPPPPVPPPVVPSETSNKLEEPIPFSNQMVSPVPPPIFEVTEANSLPPSLLEPTITISTTPPKSANQDFDLDPDPTQVAPQTQPVLSIGVPTQDVDLNLDDDPLPMTSPPPVAPPPSRYVPSQPSFEQMNETSTVETQPVVRKKSSSKNQPAPAKTGAFTWILLIYGVIATIGLAIFAAKSLLSSNKESHPFDAIPDVFGTYDKADRKKSSHNVLPATDLDVPSHLRVKLNESLTVGDLQVTPLSVERKKVNFVAAQAKGNPSILPTETVMLRLKVKNVSQSTSFHPNDPAFWRDPKKGETAYTALMIGKTPHYGAFPWPALLNFSVEGHPSEDDKPLRPGEERETFICTGRTSDTVRAVDAHKGDFLWRVQLRRGVITYTDKQGKTGDISATTVIGVQFTPDQIARK